MQKLEFIEPMECLAVPKLPDGPQWVWEIKLDGYRALVRNGFVPATRRMVYEKLKPLVTDKCPFVNLPETGRARWGEILDAEKMKKCVWVRPKLVAVIEFLEWTEGDRLRHSKFVVHRDDKNPRELVKEA